MFLLNQIGVGNMFKSLLLSTVLLLGLNAPTYASVSTYQSHGHKVKMTKFRVQKDNLYTATRDSIVNMDEAAAIIGVESGWNVKVRNKHGSSATGLFQYINSTWVSERKMFGREVNVSRTAKRTDARANLLIGIKGLERNKRLLAKSLNVNVEDLSLGDLYIGHFLGTDKAIKVINGNPNALISKYVKITKANRSLFTNKNKVRTVSQFRSAMNRKLELERNLYKRELNNLELTKLIEKTNKAVAVVINLPQSAKWYEAS